MNRMRTVGIFICGLLIGIFLTLGHGVSGQAADTSKNHCCSPRSPYQQAERPLPVAAGECGYTWRFLRVSDHLCDGA